MSTENNCHVIRANQPTISVLPKDNRIGTVRAVMYGLIFDNGIHAWDEIFYICCNPSQDQLASIHSQVETNVLRAIKQVGVDTEVKFVWNDQDSSVALFGDVSPAAFANIKESINRIDLEIGTPLTIQNTVSRTLIEYSFE